MTSAAGFSDIYEHSIDPLWRQTFYLYIRDLASQSLEVAVESVTEDEEEENILLGSADMKDLADVCDGEIHEISLDLHRCGSQCLKLVCSQKVLLGWKSIECASCSQSDSACIRANSCAARKVPKERWNSQCDFRSIQRSKICLAILKSRYLLECLSDLACSQQHMTPELS